MRRLYILLIAAGVVAFLAVSTLLTRALNVGDAEHAAITELVRAEAQGDPQRVVALITGCRTDARCRARATAVATALRRPGSVSIIQIQPSSGFALGGTLGTARVAWLVDSSLPRVQCVRVRHAGNVLAGFRVQLLEVSVRIRSDAPCQAHY